MSSVIEAPNARRFIRELLKQTRGERVTSLDLISSHASCSTQLSERLATELGLRIINAEVRLSREARLDLAMAEASRGFLYEASRFLEWMDFERFAERCLRELGFDTARNVRFKGSSRRWQVDVVGVKNSLLVCMDCKHWAPPMSPSRFRVPEMHQLNATKLFAERFARERQCEINALPIILTLFQPHFSQPAGAVIVDIQRLPGMLRDLTPYTPSMPFLTFPPEDGRKPYQAQGRLVDLKMNLVIVGAGTMGSGIAYSSITAGHDVTVVEQDRKLLDLGMRRIHDYIDKGVSKGIIDLAAASKMKSRLHGTIDFSEACRNAEIVVEAVFEDPTVKEEVFATLDKASPAKTIIASNTSSISIAKLASATRRPEKVLGLHFFNPVPTMKLVEVIKGEQTSEETVKEASKFVQSLGKTVVQSADRTGFIVNRSLMPFLNESIKLLDEGVSSREDIDKAFILGTNHPMGPLQLADFIGLDVVLSTLKVLQSEYGDCFHPAESLVKMVEKGNLGRKTKRGFYVY